MNSKIPSDDSESMKIGAPLVGRKYAKPVKVTYVQAWLYFLVVVCIVLAWIGPAKMLMDKYSYNPAKNLRARTAQGFVSLVYEGVSTLANEVNLERFKEHVDALQKAGYVAIDMNDARELIISGRPVPEKAVLLSFDHSRNSSYFDVRGILRKMKWPAVMFIWTKPIESQEPSSLRWPYVRSMVQSKFWEIAAQSHDGFKQIPADVSGRPGNYLTTPQWLVGGKRFETFDELRRRLVSDHEQCISIIEKNTGVKPIAFGFPYGDFGQYDERALLTRRLNMDLVGHYYTLGFLSGNKAYNGKYNDPRRLNRLLVKPEWSGKDLVDRLEKSWPKKDGFRGMRDLASPSAWIVDWGRMMAGRAGIQLAAGNETTGAKVWLAGSDMTSDFELDVSFLLSSGQLGLYLRASPDQESYVYLGMDTCGSIWLRQKHIGMEPVTLASAILGEINTNQIQRLQVHMRDRLFYAKLNNRSLFSENILLRGEPRPGMLGFTVWDPEKGVARANLSDMNLCNQQPTIADVSSFALSDVSLAKWLQGNAYRLTHISPKLNDMPRLGVEESGTLTPDVLAILAKTYRLAVVPGVNVRNNQWLGKVTPESLVEQLAKLRCAGLFLNFSGVMRPGITSLTQWLKDCGKVTSRNSMSMLVQFPEAIEKLTSLPAVLAQIPNLQLATPAGGAGLSRNGAMISNKVVSLETPVVPQPDMDMSLYYEIMGLSAGDVKLTAEARMDLMRQEGFSSFELGDFQKAADVWEKWSKMDPRNEEPLSLIGDAWLRMGELPKAIEYYGKSLEINPGQIGLAMRRSRLLDDDGRQEESRDLLNLYAKVFPGNQSVAMTQAEWLLRHERNEEAMRLIETALVVNSNDIRALVLLRSMLEKPEARYETMRRLLRIGDQPSMQHELADALIQNELLSLPESCVLMNHIIKTAKISSDLRIRKIYQGFLPRSTVTAADEIDNKLLSTDWQSSDGTYIAEGSRLILGARPTQAEIYLKLSGSELMRNGFVEATIDNIKGYFWLYARRSQKEMIRFGFDEYGSMYLQIWSNGKAVVNEVRPWTKPPVPVQLRIDVRGDGAQGYVDGKAMFVTPAPIPWNRGQGWWGVAPFDPRKGNAKVTLKAVAGGPLPVTLAVFPENSDKFTEDQLLSRFQPIIGNATAVSPRWFVQILGGELKKVEREHEQVVRMFTSYHRMRLLPTIQVIENAYLLPELLIKTAKEERLGGFVLQFEIMPSEAWIKAMTSALEVSPMDVIVMVGSRARKEVVLRELNLGVGIFPAGDFERKLRFSRTEKNDSITDKDLDVEDYKADAVIIL